MTVRIRHLNTFNQGRKMCKEKITQKEPPKDFIIEAFSKQVHSENHGGTNEIRISYKLNHI